ncbi:S8 family serine peptidase [uncultured Jatrophihabitans sp.]|uniref:S8 family serine peptidase n=1 Tax=uncultured Jatrophihabitans sp. TaxID=1610747 RepID=UPI0035CBE6EF
MRRLAALVAAAGLAVAMGPAAPAAAAPGPPNAPEYWFDSWGVPALWSSGARGQGVTIAEIDSGVNAALPELAGRVVPGTDLGVGGDGQVDRERSSFGHGTAMASIMVARPGLLDITGLAPDAKVLPVAVPLTGTTDAQRPDRLPDAIRYAADHGAKIINMSVGGLRDPATDDTPCPEDEQQAVFHALGKGAVVVASVGNTGPTRNTVEEPAVCLGVVSVGAVDRQGVVASFSAREPFLTVTAPGVDIPSLGRTAGDAFSGDGTSQATALVSAALALAWSAHPQLTNRQLVARLLATVDGRRTTPSSADGYGRLDAGTLVRARVPADAPNPVFAAAAPFSEREARLDRVQPVPPKPAADTPLPTGGYAVAGHPRFTDRARRATGVSAAGLVALLAVVAVGTQRRRRRRQAF